MSLYMSEEEFQKIRQRMAQQGKAPRQPKHSLMEPKEPKRTKYGNKRVEIDGFKFDSKHEADVYVELCYRKRGGDVRCVCRQVRFDLPGKISYIADFVVWFQDGRVEVWDAKSEATRQNRVYINKKKQMYALFGIEIREV